MHKIHLLQLAVLAWLYFRLPNVFKVFILWLIRGIPVTSSQSSDMAWNKIGFHTGGAPNMTGWGDYIRLLDSAKIPASLMSVGGNGLGDIIAQWENGSTVEHTAVIRYMPSDGGEDVPHYHMTPAAAVGNWLNWYTPLIGDDVKAYHTRVMTKHGNELDKNEIVWLAEFYELLHPALLERMGWQSHRIACFSFASGEPEPSDWEKILPFLRLCGENPDKWVISLHEYSYDVNDIWAGDGWLVGRFQKLYDICDTNSIPRPHLVFHEWGWELGTIAQPNSKAMSDIDEVARLYANYDTIYGAGIWTLQSYNNTGVKNKVQQLISPVGELTVSTEYPCCNEPEGEIPPVIPPPGDSTEEKIFLLGQSWAFPVNEDAALQGKMIPDGFFPTGDEQWHHVDGTQYAIQPSAGMTNTDDKRTYYAVVGDWANVMWTSGDDSVPPPIDPPPVGEGFDNPVGLSEPPSTANVWPDNWINATRFGLLYNLNNGQSYHTGADLNNNTPIWDGDCGADIYSIADGVVTFAGEGTGTWGKLIVIKHPYRDTNIYSRYAHMTEVFIEAGQTVTRGMLMGTVGTSEGRFACHLHFDVSFTSIMETNPNDWPGSNMARLVENYVDPRSFIRLSRSGMEWPEKVEWEAKRNVYLRCGPSFDFTVIKLISATERFVKFNYLDSHYLVRYDGEYGWVHEDFVGPIDDTPPIEPPPTTVDIKDYFVPTGEYGVYAVMQRDSGSTQPQQMQKLADGSVVLRKGDGLWIGDKVYQDSEQWRVKDGQVQKFVDTSDSGNNNTDAYNLHWAQWLPQHVVVGETYTSAPRVTRFNRTNCQIISDENTTDYLYVREIIPHWVSPKNSSISFDNVLVVEWRKTESLSAPAVETYWFAKNVGYVAWQSSAVNELPQGRQPLAGKINECFIS